MAESRMIDTCRITMPGEGARVLNPVTRKYENPAPVVVYEGRCRIRSASQAITPMQGGEANYSTQSDVLRLPVMESAGVDVGATVTYLTAPQDPGLVGNVYGVVAPHEASEATERRLTLRRVV
jgi:hypothetical protein